MSTSKASAHWEGGLKNGKGSFKNPSGSLSLPYSFSSRFEGGQGSNPEELLAAAHAACFTMALSLALEKNGTPPQSIETQAACSLEKVGEAYKITTMKLDTVVKATGVDAAKFREIAEKTKEACPVSGALKGNVNIVLEARLA